MGQLVLGLPLILTIAPSVVSLSVVRRLLTSELSMVPY